MSDDYTVGNRAIHEALEESGRDIKRAFAAFVEKAKHDPHIIREAVRYYYDTQALYIRDEMDD
jgi:hypothetical protein